MWNPIKKLLEYFRSRAWYKEQYLRYYAAVENEQIEMHEMPWPETDALITTIGEVVKEKYNMKGMLKIDKVQFKIHTRDGIVWTRNVHRDGYVSFFMVRCETEDLVDMDEARRIEAHVAREQTLPED